MTTKKNRGPRGRPLTGELARKTGRTPLEDVRHLLSPCFFCGNNGGRVGKRILCQSAADPLTMEEREILERIIGERALEDMLSRKREPELVLPKPIGSVCLSFKERPESLLRMYKR